MLDRQIFPPYDDDTFVWCVCVCFAMQIEYPKHLTNFFPCEVHVH